MEVGKLHNLYDSKMRLIETYREMSVRQYVYTLAVHYIDVYLSQLLHFLYMLDVAYTHIYMYDFFTQK